MSRLLRPHTLAPYKKLGLSNLKYSADIFLLPPISHVLPTHLKSDIKKLDCVLECAKNLTLSYKLNEEPLNLILTNCFCVSLAITVMLLETTDQK
jgi:hypothetical protein